MSANVQPFFNFGTGSIWGSCIDHALFLPFQLPFFGGGGVGFGVGFGGAGGLFPLPPPDGLPVVLGAFGGLCLLIF